MMRTLALSALLTICTGFFAQPASAQLIDHKMLNLDAAKKMLAAAEAMAITNKWTVSIAILDINGDLLAFERLDGASTVGVLTCQGKARAALVFGRSTKVLQDMTAGGTPMPALTGVGELNPTQGGLPIRVDGRVIGAIGVGGSQPAQDEQVAKAGVDSLGISQ